MKNSNLITLLVATALFLGSGISNLLLAQDLYRFTGKPILTVIGGSTIHDWEMSSGQSQGKAEMLVEGTSLKDVKSATVTMKAESLKSGKDKMNELAYDALKSKKHPEIKFVLTSFKNLDGKKGKATGNLTIAGTTKPVTFNVLTTKQGDVLCLEGDTAIKMSDFNMTPPTAMMGTIKTTNDLKLVFKVNFQQAAIQ
jgi:hypothetical protein